MKSRSLPASELAVMQVLWEEGRSTAREIRERLAAGGRELAHSTVVTLLNRLEEKKFVAREKADKGKAFVFRAVKKQEVVRRRLARQMLHRVFGGDVVPLFSCLIEDGALDRRQIDELRQLVERLERQSKTEGSK